MKNENFCMKNDEFCSDEPKELTTRHCASGNLNGFRRPESDLVFFERINADLAVYQGSDLH